MQISLKDPQRLWDRNRVILINCLTPAVAIKNVLFSSLSLSLSLLRLKHWKIDSDKLVEIFDTVKKCLREREKLFVSGILCTSCVKWGNLYSTSILQVGR